MVEDIDMAAQLGADGVVIGCLTPAGTVDLDSTGRLLTAAKSRVSYDTKKAKTQLF